MSQEITATTAVRDGSAAVSFHGAQAANTIDWAKQDEKIVIVIRNDNDSEAVNTATVVVSPGGYWRKDLGSLTVEVADGGSMKHIGPLDSARFKGTNGKVTVNVSVTQSGTVSSVGIAVVNL